MAALPPSLTARDRAILRDLDRVRLLTGAQLERLHFAHLATANARGSARRRTMRRLAELQLVAALARRVGGVRAGSSGLIYTLDAQAQRTRELWDRQSLAASTSRARRPWPIGWLFLHHSLDVAELYVRLRERERAGELRLRHFQVEPSSWHHGVKPDAYAVYDEADWQHHIWLEVDRGTESLPTLRRKLERYLSLAAAGDAGPQGVLPSVLVSVTSARRYKQVSGLIVHLPEPAVELVHVALFDAVFQVGARPPP